MRGGAEAGTAAAVSSMKGHATVAQCESRRAHERAGSGGQSRSAYGKARHARQRSPRAKGKDEKGGEPGSQPGKRARGLACGGTGTGRGIRPRHSACRSRRDRRRRRREHAPRVRPCLGRRVSIASTSLLTKHADVARAGVCAAGRGGGARERACGTCRCLHPARGRCNAAERAPRRYPSLFSDTESHSRARAHIAHAAEAALGAGPRAAPSGRPGRRG